MLTTAEELHKTPMPSEEDIARAEGRLTVIQGRRALLAIRGRAWRCLPSVAVHGACLPSEAVYSACSDLGMTNATFK